MEQQIPDVPTLEEFECVLEESPTNYPKGEGVENMESELHSAAIDTELYEKQTVQIVSEKAEGLQTINDEVFNLIFFIQIKEIIKIIFIKNINLIKIIFKEFFIITYYFKIINDNNIILHKHMIYKILKKILRKYLI